MSLWDIDFNLQSDNLDAPQRRLAKFSAWLHSLMKPLQWLHDLFFSDYVNGQKYAAYSKLVLYNPGDRITYGDLANYECIKQSLNNSPLDTTYWIKIQDVYIGLTERANYNGQKTMMEYFLNRYFNTSVSAMPTIYIDTIASLANNTIVYPVSNITSTITVYPSIITPMYYVFASTYTPTAYSFTIYVPTALYSAIDATPSYADAKIRALVDKYNTAGLLYNIQTY